MAREVLVGVSGGVAAYKTAELVSRLVKQSISVSVVMTKSAHQFIGKATFEALTNRPVYDDLFTPQEHPLGEHIGLPRRADLMVIAPATANILGKLAHGIADDLLTTMSLAATCPILLAPAMNTEMWNKPVVQRNLAQLVEDGFSVISPGTGWLSCRVIGQGRMAEAAEIETAVLDRLARLDESSEVC